jgi:hypothetical protein
MTDDGLRIAVDLLALALVLLFAALIAGFTVLVRRRADTPPVLRPIEAFESLPATVGRAVETGHRLHVSLGSGIVGQAGTAATLAGVTVLEQVSAAAVISDRPPIVTTADGTAMLVAQDTLRQAYARQNALERHDPFAAQVAGLTPIAFGAAQTVVQKDEAVAGSLLIGPVGTEAVLLTESARREDISTLAGTDNPPTQALLFASADHPLVGEDTFAGGAYINCQPAHVASLRAQDVVRLLLGGSILVAVAARTLGDVAARFLGP